jgi:hypothetical protein
MNNAFQVTKDGQTYDYRIPENLNLDDVSSFFKKDYEVKELKQTGRHVTGTLNNGSGDLFLKLSTTKGISVLNQNEYKWNEEFNKGEENENFKVPKNVASGEYNGLFYFITEKLEGEMLSEVPGFELNDKFKTLIPRILDLADFVMKKEISGVGKPDAVAGSTPQEWFLNKTQAWSDMTPEDVKNNNNVSTILEVVKSGSESLTTKPRHGDFTPWHLMALSSGGLGLLDGEHAMSEGVELYDVAYLIQRVHTISNRPDLSNWILDEAKVRGYDTQKLKTVLAARGVGGYLDAHLAEKSDFTKENSFRDWVLSIWLLLFP